MAITPNSNLSGVRAVSPTTSVAKPPTTLPSAQRAPVTYDYNTGKPLSPGQLQSTYNTQTGQKIGDSVPATGHASSYPGGYQWTDLSSRTPAPTPAPTPSYPGMMGAQIQARDQAAAAQPVVQPTPTYPGLVGSLANAASPSAQQQGLNQSLVSASKPTNTQTGLLGDLRNTAQGNFGIGQQAQAIGSQYAPEIARVGGLGAAAQAGYNSTGTNVVGAGNAAIASQSASQRMSALAQGEQAALQGNAQQLTAQGQAAGAYGQALGGANTQQAQQLTGLGQAASSANVQQGQQISGLGTAANLAQPSVVAQGQAVFNPLTGQTNGGSFDVGSNAQNFAQQVVSGKMTYDQAVSSMGYSNVGKAALDQAITGAGGNPLQLQASGSATQSVIGTQTQQTAGYQSALQQGQNLQQQLTDLIHTFNLNPADINGVNQGLQAIARNTSDPRYKILQNYVNDVANTYAQVLTPPGGSATDTTRGIASSMLDQTASGQSLLAVMQSLDAAARAKIAGVSTTGGSAPSSGGGGGGTVVHTSAGPVNTSW